MPHGRFANPIEAALTGAKDLFGKQALEGALTDDLRLDGRTCLVTGASAGLGFAAAVQLAQRGARVLTASRSGVPDKGEEIKQLSGSETIEMFQVDLSDLKQVHDLADTLRARRERIDVLIDNAGVATAWSRQTAQGLDAMFVTNFLAKMVLSLRLLSDGTIRNTVYAEAPRGDAPMPRLVFVSSDSHRGASAIDWHEFGRYHEYGVNKGINNYSYFKLVLNTFVCELARRLAPNGKIDVATHAMCPGPVNSEIVRDAPLPLKLALRAIFSVIFRSPERAARPLVYMAASPDFEIETGRYLHMFNPKRMDEKCYDETAGAMLWDRSIELLRGVDAWWDLGRHRC